MKIPSVRSILCAAFCGCVYPTRLIAVCIALSTYASGPVAQAGPVYLRIVDPHPTPGFNNELGMTVAALGNEAIITSPGDPSSNSHGVVYVYNSTTGVRRLTLVNPSSTGYITNFGYAVTPFGSDIIVGAYRFGSSGVDFSGVGAAYRFSGTTGALVKTYGAPSPISGDAFGASVLSSGPNILIGAPGDEPTTTPSFYNYGSIFVKNATTNALVSTIARVPPTGGEGYGNKLALGNGFVVVGAQNNSVFASNAGRAYVMDLATGSQISMLASGNPRASEYFGYSVATLGSKVIVGAPNLGSVGPNYAGAAYLFDSATGNLLHTFQNPSPGHYDWFGYSISTFGNQILIGSPADGTNGSYGSAFVFDATSYNLLGVISNPGPPTSAGFGKSTAILSNGNYVIGAPGAGRNNDLGEAYIFSPLPEPSTFILCVLGFGGLIGLARRRKQRDAAAAASNATAHFG